MRQKKQSGREKRKDEIKGAEKREGADMFTIENKSRPAFNRENVTSLNFKTETALSRETIGELNRRGGQFRQTGEKTAGSWVENDRDIGRPSSRLENQQDTRRPSGRREEERKERRTESPGAKARTKLPDMKLPDLRNRLCKGQKTGLKLQGRDNVKLKVCFGWNIQDARCDMDASAFLLTEKGKVADDSWFVFYSQTESPDGAVVFTEDPTGKDREIISLDLERLNPSIQKIAFVLTINEAIENRLNFSMIRDAYIRILDAEGEEEIVSYQPEEYYANVTSMTLGELYKHKGEWKFNPVGNGVQQDLAGQCAIYGVEIE